MIKDNIKNYKNYLGISNYFDEALKYLAQTDFSKLENGTYQIIQDKTFAIVQDYTSKPFEQGKFEAHEKFSDIVRISQIIMLTARPY